MGQCIGHGPCERCGSRDNVAHYDDGTGYCFGCRAYYGPNGREQLSEDRNEGRAWEPLHGEYRALPKRGLDEDDLRHWGYQLGEHPKLGPVHIMNVRDQTGRLIGQKYRTKDKEFTWASDTKKHPLYGAWLWPSRGKSVTITEGELDAISVSKAFGHKWPVVSLPDGTGSVRKALQASYDWLDGFEQIALCFDQDDAGQKALAEAIDLLPPGKVYVMRLPEGCKDANDCLLQHGEAVLSKCYWNKVLWKPDGIVEGREFTRERLKVRKDPGYPWPWPKMNERTYGIRKREVTLLTAAPGIGKSTLAREIAYWLRTEHDCKIGNIFLEEQNDDTAKAYVAIDNNVPLGKLDNDPDLLSDAQYDRSLERVVWDGMWFYDHFGSVDVQKLISKITYFARVCGVDFVILDHISIVVSGNDTGDERKDIDVLMTALATVTQVTGVGIIAIVHLKRVPGQSFNEGGQISLNHLRGSSGLEGLCHNAYALERNQQADDEVKSCMEDIRVLKCRRTGMTGLADTLLYDRLTGRLVLSSSFDRCQSTQADDPEEHRF